MRSTRIALLLCLVLISAGLANAAPPNDKPLTNQDVISMVKSLLPESVILSSIKSSDTDFDISATGLIALKKAGVSTRVMEAMLDAVNKRNAPPVPAATPATLTVPTSAGTGTGGAASALPAGVPVSSFMSPTGATPMGFQPNWQPTVLAVLGGAKANLAAEATQIVQTKSKATSLSALAADQALDQALQVGAQTAQQALLKSGSTMALTAINPGFAVVSGIMAYRAKQAKVTYVWALNGGNAASSMAANNLPSFEANYAGLPGVNPDQFEPVIVKLSPTPQSNFRLVGATEAASAAAQDKQQDWPIYSSFVEDRVSSKVDKLGSGHARVTPAAALGPGEYAIALRPTDKSHKFSGEEVGKNQAEGLLFNYTWPFSVK
jgi:hypothetical protein